MTIKHIPDDDDPTDPVALHTIESVIADEDSTNRLPTKLVASIVAGHDAEADGSVEVAFDEPRPRRVDHSDPDIHRAGIDCAPVDHDPDATLRIAALRKPPSRP